MRQVITSDTEQCRCGKLIAKLLSRRTQKVYRVEVRGEQATREPGSVVEVGIADFHNCAARDLEARGEATAPKFERVVEFFRGAIRKGAKRMTVTVESTGAMIAISFRDSRPVLYVTDGKPYGQSRYFGALDVDSAQLRRGRDRMSEEESMLWAEFSADPVKTAARSGHLSGRCSFCSRQLDDSRSVQHGYGPVCAEKFGMPWNAARVA